MPKIGIFGQQGSGKTLLAVLLSRLIQRADPAVTLYTNVTNVTGDESFVTIGDLSEFPFERGKPKILLLDEAMFSIDSRNASSNVNQLWSRALAYFRKSDVIATFYCTHRPSMLDSRFRDQLDAVIMCRKNPTHFDYLYIDMVSQMRKAFQIPKHKYVFDTANYDTRDFPLPIEVIGLMNDPRFQMKKFEKIKVAAGAGPKG